MKQKLTMLMSFVCMAMLFPLATMAENTTLASWTFDTSYDKEGVVYTPNVNAWTEIGTQWFNAGQPLFRPNTAVGNASDYSLSGKTSRYWSVCTGYNNQVFRIVNDTEANNITDYTDASQHNNYYEVTFPTIGYTNISLELECSYGDNKNANIQAVVSTDNGVTWKTAGEYTTASGWWLYDKGNINISATHKEKVIVRLIFGNGYSSNWNLDYLNIKGETYEAPAAGSYSITYSLGTSGATGILPSNIDAVSTLTEYIVPANTTLYKPGFTQEGWTDGENEYLIGQRYIMEEKDYDFTPVFTQNPVALSELNKELVVTWRFGKGNGAPTFDGSAQNYVKQVSLNGNTTDLAVQMAGGDNSGRNDEWMNNQQKNMTVPVCEGAVVRAKVYYDNQTCVINGENMPYDAAVNGAQGNIVYTYECPAGVGSTIDVNVGNQFLSYIEVTYPGSSDPWANFEDFEIDLRGNKFLTQSNNVSTVGFKKSGENFIACATDDADAIGTITGRSRNDDHGLVSFSMTVAVPGNVKIEAGTCQWGGNLTIKKGATTVATVNTNNGTCFHGNTTQNRVVTYYEGEATTLTISGGNYMPFISVESIDNVPALYTLTFKNGDATVSTKQIYEGTGAGTLPTINDLASDQYFLGWYSNASQIDTRINTATIPTGNTTYYAVIKTINTTNGMLVPEAGDAFSFIAHLEKANATATAQAPAKIFLQNGTYDLGTIINTEVRDNVHIIGESRGGVTVINHPAQAGMSSSETLNVRGSNVYMQNFTVRCDVSYPGSAASGVGTAIRTYGDKNIFYNMDMQGNQDTFNTPMGDDAVAYVKGGRIEGTVDYICGSGNIWFEGVNLYMNDRSNADVIAAPSTAASTQYGYVFNGCTIDGAAGQADKYNLARPWHNQEVSNVPAATWINTNCIIKPSAKGYTTMGTGRVRFHEFNTMDAEGTVITGHNFDGLNYAAGSDEIYLASIGNYTYANVLGGWDPEAVIASYNEVTPTINAQGYGTFSCAYPVQIAGVKAYKATINAQGDALECTEIENGLVPAGEGVLLYGEVGASVTATYVASAPAVSNNDLKATTLANSSLKDISEVGEKVLVLSGNTFVPYATGNPFVANKAYLTVAASAKPFRIVFNNQTTGISTVSAAKKVANAKFIENGRIVIVKDGAKYNVAGQVIK